MSWKCPSCGFEPIDDALSAHAIETGGCGYVKFPAGVVLVSEATGKELQIHVSTTCGSASLKSLEDSEIRFVASEQFKIEKRTEQGGWAVINIAYAINPLFLNGAPIAVEGAILKSGDKLSIKDKFFRLTVRLL
jgi:hypothetical protein